jgi:hypothetical protein
MPLNIEEADSACRVGPASTPKGPDSGRQGKIAVAGSSETSG